jgi:hypothetical protein
MARTEARPADLEAATVALTGAAGQIGSVLRANLRDRVGRLRLIDLVELRPEAPSEEVIVADLRNVAATTAALAGVQQVIHLAAIADEAPFPELLETSMLATFHVFEAARRQHAPHGLRQQQPRDRLLPHEPTSRGRYAGAARQPLWCQQGLR